MAIQDHNLNLTEQQYRDLELPSYSMLASIDKQGVDVVGGVKTSLNLKFGSLVDMMCFEPHRVDDNFYQGTSVANPTTNVKKICDIILSGPPKGTPQRIVGQSVLKRKSGNKSSNLADYETEILAAAKIAGVYKSYTGDKIEHTVIKGGSAYFKDRITSKGKVLIKPEMWRHAAHTAATLISHPFTAKYFAQNVPGIEIIYQYKFDTIVNGHRCKGMLDCLVVNHNAKLIFPIDLKTGELPCKDFPMLYTSHRYYIQGALYREALETIVGEDFELYDYVVKPFEFVYISKLNPNKPMRFIVSDDMHKESLKGFKDRFGYSYNGVYSLLDDYYECVSSGFSQYTNEENLSRGSVIMDSKLIIG